MGHSGGVPRLPPHGAIAVKPVHLKEGAVPSGLGFAIGNAGGPGSVLCGLVGALQGAGVRGFPGPPNTPLLKKKDFPEIFSH